MHTKRIQIALVVFMCAACGAANASADGAGAVFTEAEKLYRAGDYEKALTSYREVIEKYPDDWRSAQARFTSAFILQKKLKRPEQARDAYEKVIQHNSASPLASNAEFQIAQVYEQAGDTDKAIVKYRDFIKKANRHPREGLAQRRIDFLNNKINGKSAVPQGWATNMERRLWRRVEQAMDDDRKEFKNFRNKDPNKKQLRPRSKDTKPPDKPLE